MTNAPYILIWRTVSEIWEGPLLLTFPGFNGTKLIPWKRTNHVAVKLARSNTAIKLKRVAYHQDGGGSYMASIEVVNLDCRNFLLVDILIFL